MKHKSQVTDDISRIYESCSSYTPTGLMMMILYYTLIYSFRKLI